MRIIKVVSNLHLKRKSGGASQSLNADLLALTGALCLRHPQEIIFHCLSVAEACLSERLTRSSGGEIMR